ncbi:heavy metal translocating P-type ATPase, partial [Enterococcus lactis]|nr:heavy metal translocating P-type ATPase [Enterococcus lactis]
TAVGSHGSTAASDSADEVIFGVAVLSEGKAVVILKDKVVSAKETVPIVIFTCTFCMILSRTCMFPDLFWVVLRDAEVVATM